MTTKAEVLQMLGKPGEVVRPQVSEEVMIYEQWKNRASPGFFTTRCYLDTERLSVYMTEQGVVRDYVRDSLGEEVACQVGGGTYVIPNTTNTYKPNYSTPAALAPRTTSYH